HDDRQGPEDQRDHPVDTRRRRVSGGSVAREDDLLGVQRARPDVAVDDPEGAEREHGLAGVGDYVPPGVLQRFEAQANGLRVLLLVTRSVWPPVAEFVRSLVEDLRLAGPLARADLAIPCFRRLLHTKLGQCLVKRMLVPRIDFAPAIRAPQPPPPGLGPLRSVQSQRWSDRARRRPGRAGGRARIWSSGRAAPPRWGRAQSRCRSG